MFVDCLLLLSVLLGVVGLILWFRSGRGAPVGNNPRHKEKATTAGLPISASGETKPPDFMRGLPGRNWHDWK